VNIFNDGRDCTVLLLERASALEKLEARLPAEGRSPADERKIADLKKIVTVNVPLSVAGEHVITPTTLMFTSPGQAASLYPVTISVPEEEFVKLTGEANFIRVSIRVMGTQREQPFKAHLEKMDNIIHMADRAVYAGDLLGKRPDEAVDMAKSWIDQARKSVRAATLSIPEEKFIQLTGEANFIRASIFLLKRRVASMGPSLADGGLWEPYEAHFKRMSKIIHMADRGSREENELVRKRPDEAVKEASGWIAAARARGVAHALE